MIYTVVPEQNADKGNEECLTTLKTSVKQLAFELAFQHMYRIQDEESSILLFNSLIHRCKVPCFRKERSGEEWRRVETN